MGRKPAYRSAPQDKLGPVHLEHCTASVRCVNESALEGGKPTHQTEWWPSDHIGRSTQREQARTAPDSDLLVQLQCFARVHGLKGYARRVGSEPLSKDQANRLFGQIRGGSTEVLGILEGSPIIFVDLDAGAEALTAVPELLPAIVVGTGASADETDLVGLDLVLTEEPSPGSIDHLDLVASSRLVLEAVAASPMAAVILAQILRAGEHRSEAGDLLYESLAYSALQTSGVFQAWLATRPEPQVEDIVDAKNLVLIERDSDQLFLTLNRPERRNALGAKLRDALCAALIDASADPTISMIHLAGAGPAFCSGGDLNEFGTAPDGGAAHLVRATRSAGLHVAAQRNRVTCHVHGACVGAGIELPASAGEIIAKPDAFFRLPEVAMGLIPGAGGTMSIPRRIGRHRMNWLAISGAVINVDVALDWGLIDFIEL